MMKIAIFELEEWEQETFDRLSDDNELQCIREPLTKKTVGNYTDAQIISTFIYSTLNKEILSRFENLRLIATRSTGFDHIDLDYCDANDIMVCNVPTYGDNTVAEHVFGLLLTISHNLTHAIDRTRRGDFSLAGLRGFDLRGKTFGVIGTGAIGEHSIKIACGFGMNVLAFDVKPRKELEKELCFRYVDMDELLRKSDIITLHVPANKATHHLIGKKEFSKMKDGVVLINTSRGSVIEVEGLINALADGKVAAAGLDVLPEEPLIREEAELLRSIFRKEHNLEQLLADHVLLRLRNVYITPHSAFNTKEAVQRILDTTYNNIKSFVQGSPDNVVNEDVKKRVMSHA